MLEELLFGSVAESEREEALPVARRSIAAPRGDPRSDESYVLSHCQDFAVVDKQGATGFVSDIRFLSRVDRPDELEITKGRFRPRTAWVPVSQVESISSERTEIILSAELPWSRRIDLTRQLLARARQLTL